MTESTPYNISHTVFFFFPSFLCGYLYLENRNTAGVNGDDNGIPWEN